MRGFASVRNSSTHRKFIASALMLLVAFCVPAADLKRIDAGSFTFDVPRDMVKASARGIDSHVGEYQNSRIRLGFDFGAYSDPLDYGKEPGFQSSKLVVDGRKARIVSFRQEKAWFTAIHFPDAGRARGDGVKLTMNATCTSDQDLQLAREIFTSIRFK